MRVLFDTDVVLDLVLDREPFVEAAAALFELHEHREISAYISGVTLINVFYITRKIKDISIARQAVGELPATLRACPLDQSILESAYTLAFTDYEDAVQHESASSSLLDAIVTRNVGDYKNAALPVFTPSDFLNHLKQTQP